MTPRHLPSILDEASARHDWAARDPMTLTLPLRKVPTPSYCRCVSNNKNHYLGGQQPRIDLSERVIRCATCRREIPASCKRRQVSWLRSLMNAPEGHTDFDSISDLIWSE